MSLPGFDHVGISTVDRKGKITTRAATGPLVWELDTLQYTRRAVRGQRARCRDGASGLDPTHAFLARTSSHSNTKMRDVAAQMLEDHNSAPRQATGG